VPAEERGDLWDREADLLSEGDERQPGEYVGTVDTASAAAAGRGDEPGLS
jgi:hypothetical protein